MSSAWCVRRLLRTQRGSAGGVMLGYIGTVSLLIGRVNRLYGTVMVVGAPLNMILGM